jgi:hypothetical protein
MKQATGPMQSRRLAAWALVVALDIAPSISAGHLRQRGRTSGDALCIRRRDVAAMAERLEQVEVMVAAGRISLAATRLDVVHLELAPAHPAVLARTVVSRARALARVTPEVVVDEVGAAAIAAPAAPAGRQRAPAPGALALDIGRGFAAFDEQAIDLGHGRHLPARRRSAPARARLKLAADSRRASAPSSTARIVPRRSHVGHP